MAKIIQERIKKVVVMSCNIKESVNKSVFLNNLFYYLANLLF